MRNLRWWQILLAIPRWTLIGLGDALSSVGKAFGSVEIMIHAEIFGTRLTPEDETSKLWAQVQSNLPMQMERTAVDPMSTAFSQQAPRIEPRELTSADIASAVMRGQRFEGEMPSLPD